MQQVLITGGAGFIGSHLQDAFLDIGFKVVIFDDLSWGERANVDSRAIFVRGSVLDLDGLLSVMRQHSFDLVVHCAASLEVTLSQESPTVDLDLNTRGTINVLEGMRKSGISRLVNFSSACVYGFGEIGMMPSSVIETPVQPQWGYGSSKASAEIYTLQYAKTYGFCVTNYRPGIICGPREWYGRALTVFLNRALSGEKLVVFGDGRQERDFTHVADVPRIVMAELDMRPSSSGVKTYNIGTGVATAISDLAAMIGEKLRVDIDFENLREGDISNKVAGRIRLPFEMQSMRLEMQNAKDDFGFSSIYSLGDILDDEIDWLGSVDLAKWSSRFKV